MTNETTDNFWAAFAETPNIKPLKIFYRLYYNDHGYPLFYSMEDLPGNYIDIDAKTYAESASQVRVINGQILKNVAPASTKLVPSSHGIACDPRDVCVVVNEAQSNTKWNLNTYEQN
jgi:hypothetical protein